MPCAHATLRYARKTEYETDRQTDGKMDGLIDGIEKKMRVKDIGNKNVQATDKTYIRSRAELSRVVERERMECGQKNAAVCCWVCVMAVKIGEVGRLS